MVEIIMKIIKSEALLRVTPPKIKKIKKYGKGRVRWVWSGVGGGGCLTPADREGSKSKEHKAHNTLIHNYLQALQMLFFTYNTDVLHEKGEKGIIFIYTIRYIDIIFIL